MKDEQWLEVVVRSLSWPNRGGLALPAPSDVQRLAEEGSAWMVTGKKNGESGYGVAFVEPDWLRENWADDLEVLGDNAQSFAVGEKRPS